MDILKSSQLVIFSHSTIFITFSYRSLAGFLFKLLRSSRRRKPEVALDFCVWPLYELSLLLLCSLHTAAAPAVRAAVKTWLSYLEDKIIVIFCPANTNKDNANGALGSCNSWHKSSEFNLVRTPHFVQNTRAIILLGNSQRTTSELPEVGAKLEAWKLKIETLRLRFGDLTTNDKPRFAVSSFMLAVCPYLGLKIRGLTNSRLPFLFSFVRSLVLAEKSSSKLRFYEKEFDS